MLNKILSNFLQPEVLEFISKYTEGEKDAIEVCRTGDYFNIDSTKKPVEDMANLEKIINIGSFNLKSTKISLPLYPVSVSNLIWVIFCRSALMCRKVLECF